MPIHDWTRGHPSLFHDHHLAWTAALRTHLNRDGLPGGLYARVEYTTPDGEPPAFVGEDDLAVYAARRRRVAIRREEDDAMVAQIETVTPGDKRDAASVARFVEALRTSLDRGTHVVLIDPWPAGPFDPGGMHGVLRAGAGGRFDPPPGRPVTVTAYTAGTPLRWKVSSAALGSPLPDPCLSLDRNRRMRVPLEATYLAAYADFPQRWKPVIEGTG